MGSREVTVFRVDCFDCCLEVANRASSEIHLRYISCCRPGFAQLLRPEGGVVNVRPWGRSLVCCYDVPRDVARKSDLVADDHRPRSSLMMPMAISDELRRLAFRQCAYCLLCHRLLS